MKNFKLESNTKFSHGVLWSALSLLIAAFPQTALTADSPVLSDSPIANTTSVQVKPNIMLLMDTSNSMKFSHMPDEIEGSNNGVFPIGYKSYQCNVLYYKPSQIYALPNDSTGATLPLPTFNAAFYNAYAEYVESPLSVPSTVVNLGTSFQAYDTTTRQFATVADAAQPAYYYIYTTAASVEPSSLNFAGAPCTDTDVGATTPASTTGTWTRVLVSTLTAAEQKNFAIWYSYYRTRISMIKSAVSLSFTPLTDSYRVGLVTVKPYPALVPTLGTSVAAANYLAINDFGVSQRQSWFKKLFDQVPGGSSPAREGLARVGRHYAGKQDSINTGMTGDPVQYSCQQNFTIMTTDGYWNTVAETAGPVKLDGVTLVGQQDGTLNQTKADPNTLAGTINIVPRPIWDGYPDTSDVRTVKGIEYQLAACSSLYGPKSTNQNLQSTVQNLQSTVQMTQSTNQNLQSTNQNLRSTNQILQSTNQIRQSTNQILKSTNQNLKSTNQNLQSTTQTRQSTQQNLQSTNQNRRSTNQNLQSTTQNIQTSTQNTTTTQQITRSTVQNLRSTNQNRQSTTQTLQSTNQNRQSTVQNLKSTNQNRQSTTQTLQSTNQNRQSTVQNLKSTTQTLQSTTQLRQSTSQWFSYDSSTELSTAVASCTNGGTITCTHNTTTNVPVASCTAQVGAAGNLYLTITCSPINTGPTAVASCTAAAANSGNSYTATTCTPNNTSNVPVASCTASAAASGNAYTTTTCSTNNTTNVPVATCTAAVAASGNSWTTTSCPAAITTGPTGVSSCTAAAASSGNSYTSTTCTPNNTTNVPVATCTAAAAASGNSWTTTTCPAPVVTTSVPVATCTAAAAASGNSWTTTTCPAPVVTTNVPVATCTAAVAASGNSWTTTTCPAAITTGPTGVSSCTAAAASSGNSYTSTTCTPNNTTNVPVATCTAAAAASGNSWTATTCPAPVVTTNVPVSTCTAAVAASGNSWTTTTCPAPVVTTNVAVATCTAAVAASGNSWTTTTCPAPITTGPSAVSSCTAAAASSGNSYTSTTCTPNNTTNVPVATCTASAANSGNSWTTTTCPAPVVTTNVPVATCTAAVAASGNSWTTTTCPAPVVTTNVPVASCTAAAAASGNSWTTTTCVGPTILTGPTVTATCTAVAAAAGNGYVATVCGVITNAIPVATCTPQTANAGNGWTTITCGTNNTSNVPVATCTASAANAGNAWTTTTCPAPIVTTNVPVATCTAAAAASGNAWTTTTCPAPVVTTNVPVATCTAAAAASGNSWTTTTCPAPIVTGPTGVASCTSVVASSGNSWTATTCAPNNTSNVPVATCTASAANAGNSWTTTTCPAPVVTTNVPTATCTAAVAASGNSWTTTTCPAPVVTTNVPAASCTAAAAASGNSWTTTTCPAPVVTTNVPVGSCTAAAAASGNSWTTTTCPAPVVTTNVGVPSCTAAAASSGNSWTTITCPAPVVTTNVPVATCTAAVAAAGNSYTTTTCPAPVVTTSVPVATCTAAVAASGNSWTTTTCPAPVTTSNVPVSGCTAAVAAAGNSYTTTTCTPNNTTNVPVAACVSDPIPNAGNSWTATTCSTNNTTNVPVASCVVAAPVAGNAYTDTSCPAPITTATPEVYNCVVAAASAGNSWTSTACGPTLPGNELKSRLGTTVTTSIYSGTTLVSSSTPPISYSPSSGYGVTDGVCVPVGSTLLAEPAIWPPVDRPPTTLEIAPPVEPVDTADTTYTVTCTSGSWPCTLLTVTNAGSKNSLADVAQYYYTTDLRTGTAWDSDLAATPVTKNDNVPAAGTGPEDDSAPWQHMTTYTIALGVSGTVNYSKTYKDDASGDFADLRSGAKAWPIWPDTTLDYASNGALYSDPRSIDDFWHTAVDGRGRYFSAGKPSDVVDGLRAVLNDLGKKQGSGAAAASSSQTPVQGNNIAYVAKYATTSWAGDIEAREIDLTNGQVKSTVLWSAQPLLDAKTGYYCDSRNIYLFRSGATNNMVDFKWNTGTCSTQSIPAGTAPTAPIPASTSVVVATGAIVVKVTKDTITYPFPAVLTATAQTGAAAPRDLTGGDAVLAGDTIVTSAGVTVTLSVPASTTVATAGTVAAVSRDTTTYPSPFVLTATAKTGAGAARAINAGDAILAGDVVATTAGVTVKIEHVISPVTTLDGAASNTEQSAFDSTKIALFSQYPDMSDGTSGYPDQRTLAAGDNLVNFVRGQRGHEGFVAKDAVKVYRKRDHVLGDLVDAQPVFVKAPFASYSDAGYTSFKDANASRKSMIYAAANDGMLHAFYAGTPSYNAGTGVTTIDATGGEEAWAFIPTMVLGDLFKLADNDYANKHVFLVDGTPTVGDVYDSTGAAWKTVLVAGLNKGGKGYYALDVTDPDNPKALWEFKYSATCYSSGTVSTHGADCNLGYSFGKPVITKLSNGTWVAIVTSGYNNVNGATGDGEGFLYVLNAMTGKIISKTSTGNGNATTPSGLAQVNNFVDNAFLDNTTKYVYGGDNNGNVWRFVINEVADDLLTVADESIAAHAVLLGVAKDSANRVQPITTRPELGEIAGKPWVFVGTGRLLGTPDLTDVYTQSVYGFKDDVTVGQSSTATLYSDLRGALRPLLISPATAANANPAVGASRTVSCTGSTAECARPSGWVVDLPDSGERINIDLNLELGTLFFASNVPRNTACNIGGYSWLNYLNYRTGLAVQARVCDSSGNNCVANTNVSTYLGESLAVGMSTMRLPPPASNPGGQGKTVVVVMGSSGVPTSLTPPVEILPPVGKRVSWREVVQ